MCIVVAAFFQSLLLLIHSKVEQLKQLVGRELAIAMATRRLQHSKVDQLKTLLQHSFSLFFFSSIFNFAHHVSFFTPTHYSLSLSLSLSLSQPSYLINNTAMQSLFGFVLFFFWGRMAKELFLQLRLLLLLNPSGPCSTLTRFLQPPTHSTQVHFLFSFLSTLSLYPNLLCFELMVII